MRRSWTTGWLAVVAAAFCAASVAGCNSFQSSGIDPTGEHFFTPPPPPPTAVAAAPVSPYPPNERYFDDPMGPLPWDDVAVLIEPREIVAPVGSEVIVIAGVLGPDGYLRTNRRLEWSIAPGGVGQFVAVEPGGFIDPSLGDFNWPRIDQRHHGRRQHLAEQRPAQPRRPHAGKRQIRASRRRLDHAHFAVGRHELRQRRGARSPQLGRPQKDGRGSLGRCLGACIRRRRSIRRARNTFSRPR